MCSKKMKNLALSCDLDKTNIKHVYLCFREGVSVREIPGLLVKGGDMYIEALFFTLLSLFPSLILSPILFFISSQSLSCSFVVFSYLSILLLNFFFFNHVLQFLTIFFIITYDISTSSLRHQLQRQLQVTNRHKI